MTRSRRATFVHEKKRALIGTKNATRVHLVSFPPCLWAGPHTFACDLPSFLAARSRVRSCSHKLSAKSLSTSGWASQKFRQPLSFPRFSRAWWTNLNRCRKSVMQLGHVEVSPIFRERVHRRPCFLLACWSLAISEMASATEPTMLSCRHGAVEPRDGKTHPPPRLYAHFRTSWPGWPTVSGSCVSPCTPCAGTEVWP